MSRLQRPIRFLISAVQVMLATLALGVACLLIGFASQQ